MGKVNISLKAARVNAEKTRKEWAFLLGVTEDKVRSWESGRSEPTLEQLKKISELSGIPMDFIYVPTNS